MTEAVDFFFEIERNPEPDDPTNLYFITQTAWDLAPADAQWPVPTLVPGAVIDSWTTSHPYEAVEAAREAQAFTLEERMDMQFEREMEGRR